MKFLELTLTNIGQFRGSNKFDLLPKANCVHTTPIILIGGKNGAGKTTFLESILLCLYGSLTIGVRPSNPEYLGLLENKIHDPKGACDPENYASIRLRFSHTRAGKESVYEIQRYWERKKEKTNEQLLIHKNGKLLNDIRPDQWQDFINSIIPLPLTNLFFFDGEKIKDLAESTGHDTLSEAFESLLGLDLVQQLEKDLGFILLEEAKRQATSDLKQELENLDRESRQLEEDLNMLQAKAETLREEKDIAARKLIKKETELKNRGGGFSEERENNVKQLQSIQTTARLKEEQLRELIAGLFPFTLVPELTRELSEQLAAEEKQIKGVDFADLLKNSIFPVLRNFFTEKRLASIGVAIENHKIEQIPAMLEKNLDRELNEKQEEPARIIHDVSKNQLLRFQGIMEEIKEKIPERIRTLRDEIVKLRNSEQQLKSDITRAPAENLLKESFEEIKRIQKELTEHELNLANQIEAKQTAESGLTTLKKKREKILKKTKEDAKQQQKQTMITSIQMILREYEEQLKEKKMELLEEELVRCWKLLSRKEGFVEKVRIDRKTFEVTLYNDKGHTNSKKSLSSGEKQMYAIAILWALARLSGRPLPVIIDTPLGRLDSDHRTNLVNNYFPYASHQVLILSTDTELDRSLYKEIEPAISHQYHIQFDDRQKKTEIKTGYFWN